MGIFPETSTTLLQKLAVQETGEDESSWERFFALYTPAITHFVALIDPHCEVEDAVQDIYVKLVEVVRQGRYDRAKSRFRTFLAMLIRRHLISLYRRERLRREAVTVPYELMEEDVGIPPEQARQFDLVWARAKHEAAVEHVLVKTAISEQSRAVYRALTEEGRSIAEVASAFGITENLVRQIQFRINKRIGVVEEELHD